MQAEYIIIGQGVSGTFLSYELQKAGKSFIVIDDQQARAASKVTPGVINPVTGKRVVKTWLIDELMPYALHIYNELGQKTGVECISQKSFIEFFSNPELKIAFNKRIEDNAEFVSLPKDENDWQQTFNYGLGYGIISPCYMVNLHALLPAYQKFLSGSNSIINDHFDIAYLETTASGIQYKDIKADKIIFCDGAAGFNNPYFRNLPYGANKGEALLVEIDELPADNIYKNGYRLVPIYKNVFWLGSTYLWEYEDANPTPGFYQFAKNWLAQTIKVPYKIVHHIAGIRPSTMERKPFIGFHPIHKNIGTFNGFGTKGCSLAPYFAQQFVKHITQNEPIMPEVSVERYKQVLSREI